ncbi:hypothetical protein [Halobaculum sp. D14]|uniref:hypothetical protein n=1 Tax=unclassified Halobaculum TaxID=2640896 RepID=UPI003EBC7167
MNRQVLIGVALMIVGTALFLPSIQPLSSQLTAVALAPAAILLTVGTYLVGTSEGGRPV